MKAGRIAPIWRYAAAKARECSRLTAKAKRLQFDLALAEAQRDDAVARAERRAEEAERQAVDLRGQLISVLERLAFGPAEGE